MTTIHSSYANLDISRNRFASPSMTFPTTPAFIVSDAKGWKDVTAHPVMAWMQESMERIADWTDRDELDYTIFFTSDFKYQRMNGMTYSGENAWIEIDVIYAVFAEAKHEPSGTVVAWETEKGWEMMGQFFMWANLRGPPTPLSKGDSWAIDSEGREWDRTGLAMFYFKFVKDPSALHGGLHINECRMWAEWEV
ncbi:hypothetical protein EJ06DRAFT_533675 [Trichodelitschia bisporula]|uniref:SnoaL-like domain-containing protein n=1 Tax=Trichodelitschia bisporula TaxID=703511 RepID=A0A6G1HLT8_9PEZI|nr:hypothetical protein EJ06DRAFT_533675 [Trichodelitschia bisporula]